MQKRQHTILAARGWKFTQGGNSLPVESGIRHHSRPEHPTGRGHPVALSRGQGQWQRLAVLMELVFQDTLTSSHTSCLAVARFAAPVLLTQVRVTSHGAHDRPLQLLVHSMPSSSKPYAHFKSFTLSLAASPEPTQVFDLPVSPEHTMPARLLIFRGPWNGVHVEAYGFIQKKRPRPGPSSSSAVEPKRVKMEEPTPEPSTSQEVTAAVTPMKVPDWDEIHSLLQAHRTSKTQRHRSRDVDPETMKAARHAWKQTISNGDTEFQDLLANCRRLNANVCLWSIPSLLILCS